MKEWLGSTFVNAEFVVVLLSKLLISILHIHDHKLMIILILESWFSVLLMGRRIVAL